MKNKNYKKIVEKIITVFIFTGFLFLSHFVFLGEKSVIAQSLGQPGSEVSGVGVSVGTTQISLIGGTTGGVTGICCNAIKLEFSSVRDSNSYIADDGDEVLWMPGKTESFKHGNEFTEGYNTLGRLASGECMTIESECESAEDVPYIQVIGTSEAES